MQVLESKKDEETRNLLKETNKLPQNGVVIKTIVTTESARSIAEDFDIELLRDALSSQEAIFRFSGYQNYDYVLTQQNRQAITDVLNAYNLMCSVSPDVLRKALA